MVIIKIGETEKDLDNVDESWINQQINRHRADGHSVCARVTIREGDLDIILSTPTCGSGAGGGRPLRPHEKVVVDLWEKRGLKEPYFTGSNLIAFLRQLKNIL